jgi:tripartite-type tricarboxylate transporter receptor subunit TctC
MWKLLSILVTAMVTVTSSWSRENFTIVYAFGAGDSVATYFRSLATEANRIQDRYNFIFDTKPGAGGAIAANHVLNTPNTILAHSTAFFVRPVVFPNESYDLSRFRQQYVNCLGPMAVISSRYRSWSEVPRTATVGISGLGVTTHLAAVELKKTMPDLVIVPFKSTNDSMLSMVSAQTDLHIGFIGQAEQWSKDNTNSDRKVTVLGITGTKTINNHTPLVRQGFAQTFADMNVGHHMVIPTQTSAARHNEIYAIFSKAAQMPSVKAAYAVDHCEPRSLKLQELDDFFQFHTHYWKNLASQIKIHP